MIHAFTPYLAHSTAHTFKMSNWEGIGNRTGIVRSSLSRAAKSWTRDESYIYRYDRRSPSNSQISYDVISVSHSQYSLRRTAVVARSIIRSEDFILVPHLNGRPHPGPVQPREVTTTTGFNQPLSISSHHHLRSYEDLRLCRSLHILAPHQLCGIPEY